MKRCEGELVLQELAGRAEQSVLWWFGHMERMEEDLLVKRIIGSVVRGERCEVERKAMNGMDGRCEKSVE